MTTDELHSELLRVERRIVDDLGKIEKVILGNGTPERGLVFRVSTLERGRRWKTIAVTAVVTTLLGLASERLWGVMMGPGKDIPNASASDRNRR